MDSLSRHSARAFDPDALRAELQRFELASWRVPGSAEQDYLAYYSIDFNNRNTEVVHHFGTLRCNEFELATHYFVHPRPRGTCVLVHGYFDHTGLYRHLIQHCLEAGYSVVMHDLPGHGLSTGEPAAIGSFDEYLQAFCGVLDRLGSSLPRPWIAIGQSTGAAILMKYLLERRARPSRDGFARTVLLAPLVRPAGWRSGKVLYPLLNPFRRSLPRKFMRNSGDDQFVQFLEQDPLQARNLPLSWVGAMFAWVREFEQAMPGHEEVDIIQGDGDSTVDWRGNLPMIRLRFPKARLTMINGASHHLVNETPSLRQEIFSHLPL